MCIPAGEETCKGVEVGSDAACCAGEGVGIFVGVGVFPMTIGLVASWPFFTGVFLGGARPFLCCCALWTCCG